MTVRVAAIVAAAGLSRRMGTCKQLLDLGGKSVLARCVESLLGGGVAEIVVVVGTAGTDVAAEARRLPVRVVLNPDPDGDMASSVGVGADALPTEITGVIVALCDHPLVAPLTVEKLIAAHDREADAILIPRHDGRNGHPTLFPTTVLEELAAGGTLRDIVRRDSGRVRYLDVADRGILLDMDTPGDYRRIRALVRPAEAEQAP